MTKAQRRARLGLIANRMRARKRRAARVERVLHADDYAAIEAAETAGEDEAENLSTLLRGF
jgi:hypothetical protein